jgi:hypothetical protein
MRSAPGDTGSLVSADLIRCCVSAAFPGGITSLSVPGPLVIGDLGRHIDQGGVYPR